MRTVSALIFSAVMGLLSGCTDSQTQFENHFALAEAAFTNKQFNKARIEFKNALQILPDDVHANYRLARTEQELQRWAGAVVAFRHAIRLEPTHLPSRLGLARIYLGSEDPSQAAEHIDVALNTEPNSADALALRASMRLLTDDMSGAIRDAQGALNRAPERGDLAMLLVSALVQDEQWDSAKAMLDKAIAAHPSHQPLWELKAKIEYNRGQHQAAAETLTTLLEIAPERSDVRDVLATIYAELDTPAQAEALLKENVERAPDEVKAKLSLVRHLVQTKDTEAGIEQLRLFLADASTNAPLRFALAELLVHQGNHGGASEVLQALIRDHELDPVGLRARQLLALVHAQERQLGLARRLVEEVLTANPRDREALLLRGGLALIENDPGTAILTLRTVLRDYPEDLAGRKLLARAHVLNNEWAQGQDELQRAIETNPDDLDSHLLLVQLIDQVDDSSLGVLRANTLQAAKSLLDGQLRNDQSNNGAVVSRGKVALLAGEYDAAVNDLRAAVETDPANAEALRLLAHVEARMGNNDATQARLEQALAADKSHVPSRLDYARHLAGKGDLLGALTQLGSGLELSPRNFNLLRLKAQVEQDLGRWDALAQSASAIQEVASSDPLGFYLQGIALQARGDFERSATWLKQALERSPNAVEPLTALARTYFAAEQHELALEILNRALAASPRNLAALNLRGEVLLAQGQYNDAEASFEQALSVRPDWTVPYQNLGDARLAQGNTAGAIEAFVKLADVEPENTLAAYRLAITYERLGKVDLAIAQYEAILSRDANEVVAANNLAMLLCEKGRRTPGNLARALALTAGFEQSARPHFLDTRAWVLLASGRAEQAEKLLRRIVAEHRDEPIYRYHLAMAQIELGRREDALANLEAALRTEGQFPERGEATEVLAQLRR